jgi:phage FluMu protein Com
MRSTRPVTRIIAEIGSGPGCIPKRSRPPKRCFLTAVFRCVGDKPKRLLPAQQLAHSLDPAARDYQYVATLRGAVMATQRDVVFLPCQFCNRLERRAVSSACRVVTCFECKTVRNRLAAREQQRRLRRERLLRQSGNAAAIKSAEV